MLHFCCVKAGSKYGPEYVNILFDMVRRNLNEGTPGRFVCFTDDPSGLSPGVEVQSLPEGIDGWWNKLYLFSPDAFPKGDRVIYLDLDVVITGALEPLLEYKGRFAALQDRYLPNVLNSGVMMWEAGVYPEIWEAWLIEGKPDMVGGDQAWIQYCLKKYIGERPDYLQGLYPSKIFSFKLECLDSSAPPRDSMIVYFHGEPRPHNCTAEWVKQVWKIGGGTADDLLMICNVKSDAIKQNIRLACKRDVPWIAQLPPHTEHAVIIGGAPSLKTKIEEIRERHRAGQKLFATNNTYKFLLEHGIEADYQVILDARAENASFIADPLYAAENIYLASQCHPDVWDTAELGPSNVVLFHCHSAELEGSIENPEGKPECLIACGSTVGLNTMGIAYTLGFRTLHLYGMDSCYSEDEHHAYSQPGNDGEIVLEANCYGRIFKASPWMIHQANQFQELLRVLVEDDCVIVAHGPGLIPWLVLQTQYASEPDTEIVEIDGVWWPSRDLAMKANLPISLSHVAPLVEKCKGRRVAVQAGGNIGLWPREMAKYFERVITFEPDKLNLQCLRKNLTAPNVTVYETALGEKVERKGLARRSENCGAHHVVDGDEFQTMAIDSLELDACDLIQLDIEGFELMALGGAEKTIEKFKPTICLELNGNAKTYYGHDDSVVIDWLLDRGYIGVLKFGQDIVFVNNERKTICNTDRTSDMSLAQTAL